MDAPGATLRSLLTSSSGGAALRREVRRHLAAAGIAPAVVDDALLVLSELVTNAFDASPAAAVSAGAETVDGVDVTITVLASTVRLVVQNTARTSVGDPRRPPLVGAPVSMPLPASPRGRGLPLVAALATRVAVDSGGPVTAVCAELWSGARCRSSLRRT